MTCRGHVKNGVVVFDDPVELPEGTSVEISFPSDGLAEAETGEEPIGDMLMRYAGILKDLPSDMARNHDHYAHGKPKA